MSDKAKEFRNVVILLVLVSLSWVLRLHGPIDIRWNGGSYIVLAASLAEGKGYRMLNEPGEIKSIQDPPLYPAFIAAHMSQTQDLIAVAERMRLSNYLLHVLFILAGYLLARMLMPSGYALLAGIICALNTSFIYLSDVSYPEMLLGVLTILFLCSLRFESKSAAFVAFLLATLAFFVRTIAWLLLAVWVLQVLLQKRWKTAAVRALLIAIPLIAWFGYVHMVRISDDFDNVAYPYQRADHIYTNTTYARFIQVRSPLQPEHGKAGVGEIAARMLHYLPQMPKKIGANVVVNYGYLYIFLNRQNLPFRFPADMNYYIAYFFGWIAVAGWLVLIWKREWLLASFLLAALLPVSIWQLSDDMWRLLIPLAQVHTILFVLALLTAKAAINKRFPGNGKAIGTALLVLPLIPLFFLQFFAYRDLFKYDYRPVSLESDHGKLAFRWFHYAPESRGIDEALDWLRVNGDKNKIVVSNSPYYVYLRTGMKAVRGPWRSEGEPTQQLLQSIPAGYLMLGGPVNHSAIAVEAYPERWQKQFNDRSGEISVFRMAANLE